MQLVIIARFNKDQSDNYQREVTQRLTNIKRTVEDLKEKTWKLDNNTRSNLVFYGIKEDGGSCCNAEFSVKEVHIKLEILRFS